MKFGIVIKSTGSWFNVQNEDGEIIPCKIRGRIRLDGLKSTNPVAVGDKVQFDYDSKTKSGVITKICERKNYIIRRSTNLSKQTQIIAANIDQAILMVTINYPVTSYLFIDRFLASCQAYRIPCIIIFNKIDQYNDQEIQLLEEYKTVYEEIGYQTLSISATKQTSLNEVKEILTNKTTLISGHSGVGKSTLINQMEPGLNLKTGTISEAHQTGKHTTTFAEMHPFSFGGYVIDTPGIRGFGLANVEKEELYHFFVEFFEYAKNCHFHNCQHINEPNCAVKDAIEDGKIAFSRYDSYVSIYFNRDEKYR